LINQPVKSSIYLYVYQSVSTGLYLVLKFTGAQWCAVALLTSHQMLNI